ncbi:MAG: 50S ribosomal protein L10, partial [Clostridia bacterium]
MASKNILEQKKLIVEGLVNNFKNSAAGVLVDYQGINVQDDTKLRANLRKSGIEYAVVKNTLTAKACDIVGFDALKVQLNGMSALAISATDPIAAAKIICDYAKDHENYKIKGGFLDGELLDENGVKALAEIPSKEVLVAKLLGSLQSSLYAFCYAIQAIIDKSGEAV